MFNKFFVRPLNSELNLTYSFKYTVYVFRPWFLKKMVTKMTIYDKNGEEMHANLHTMLCLMKIQLQKRYVSMAFLLLNPGSSLDPPPIGYRKICSESFVIQVYETTTSALVKDILTGYNATVFAYGATGAGKTHTMVGSTHNPGVMVRAINELFEAVAAHDNPDYFTVC